jgi:hypothetical protein
LGAWVVFSSATTAASYAALMAGRSGRFIAVLQFIQGVFQITRIGVAWLEAHQPAMQLLAVSVFVVLIPPFI